MAKRIVWSIRAKTDRREILEYWHCRNKSKAYSQKLFRYFQETIVQISTTPTIGKPTSALGVRSMVVRDYLIIYEEFRDHILILTLWDSRQRPERLGSIIGGKN